MAKNTSASPHSQPSKESRSDNLYAFGLILVVVSSLIHFFTHLPWAAWLLAVSGGVMALAVMIKGAMTGSKSSTRTKRLDRMRMIGGLIFLVAGGFAIEGQSLWILLFAGATVFTLYGIFVGDKAK